jgi:hypothetical protein
MNSGPLPLRRPSGRRDVLGNGCDLPFRERFHLPLEEPDRRADTPDAPLASARASGGRVTPRRAIVRSGRPLCPAADRRSFGVQVSILGDTRSRRQPGPGVEMITLRSTAPGRAQSTGVPATGAARTTSDHRCPSGPGRDPDRPGIASPTRGPSGSGRSAERPTTCLQPHDGRASGPLSASRAVQPPVHGDESAVHRVIPADCTAPRTRSGKRRVRAAAAAVRVLPSAARTAQA